MRQYGYRHARRATAYLSLYAVARRCVWAEASIWAEAYIYIYIFPGYTFDAAQRRINLATLTWNCHVDFSCDLDFFSIMRKGVEFTIFCDHCNAFSMYIFYFMTA